VKRPEARLQAHGLAPRAEARAVQVQLSVHCGSSRGSELPPSQVPGTVINPSPPGCVSLSPLQQGTAGMRQPLAAQRSQSCRIPTGARPGPQTYPPRCGSHGQWSTPPACWHSPRHLRSAGSGTGTHSSSALQRQRKHCSHTLVGTRVLWMSPFHLPCTLPVLAKPQLTRQEAAICSCSQLPQPRGAQAKQLHGEAMCSSSISAALPS
jgi:hypothetical protein